MRSATVRNTVQHTTVADLAAISKSVHNASMVVSSADISGPDRRVRSRRHSAIKALKIFSEISNDLENMDI